MWKISVFGIFNKVINFITESVKKNNNVWAVVPDWMLFSQKNKQISIWKEKLAPEQFPHNRCSFSQYGAYFDGRPEMLTTCYEVFQKMFSH